METRTQRHDFRQGPEALCEHSLEEKDGGLGKGVNLGPRP